MSSGTGGSDDQSSSSKMSPQSTSRRKSNGNSGVSGAAHQYARKVNEQEYSFDGWKITVLKSPILPSNCYCELLNKDNTRQLVLESGIPVQLVKFANASNKTEGEATAQTIKCQVCRYNEKLNLKHYPDMVFPDNYLYLVHENSGVVLEFNTLEAMKLISSQDTESIRVECSEAWQASKVEMGLPKNILHDYNWTFSTDYNGTIRSAENGKEVTIINNPTEELNLEKLKQREQILFYDELTLFEDELHDHGISNLGVKLRVMPSGFFILLRHALRVDRVMARICDTRIYYEVGHDYFLRQFQVKQESFQKLGDLDPQQFSDINSLSQLLPVTKETTEKVMIV